MPPVNREYDRQGKGFLLEAPEQIKTALRVSHRTIRDKVPTYVRFSSAARSAQTLREDDKKQFIYASLAKGTMVPRLSRRITWQVGIPVVTVATSP